MAESNDEDNFPNDFDGLDFDSIPGLQATSASTHIIVPPSMGLSGGISQTSSETSGAEEMDASFLAAVDALEARALREMRRDSESLPCARLGTASLPFTAPQYGNRGPLMSNSGDSQSALADSSQGEPSSSLDENQVSSVDRKGKRKAEPPEENNVQIMLEGYETELTCPICCDVLVGAHVSNPCGHTCCGECGYGWLAQSKYEPTCAVCRSNLSIQNPMLPNFSVDNLVRQHLQALGRSGRPEWQEKGYKTIEWSKRLEYWKKQAVARAAKERSRDTGHRRWRQPRHFPDGYPYAVSWYIDEDPNYEDGPVARVVSRRGTRHRR